MRHFLPEIRRISPVATSGHLVMTKGLEGSVSGCTSIDSPVSKEIISLSQPSKKYQPKDQLNLQKYLRGIQRRFEERKTSQKHFWEDVCMSCYELLLEHR